MRAGARVLESPPCGVQVASPRVLGWWPTARQSRASTPTDVVAQRRAHALVVNLKTTKALGLTIRRGAFSGQPGMNSTERAYTTRRCALRAGEFALADHALERLGRVVGGRSWLTCLFQRGQPVQVAFLVDRGLWENGKRRKLSVREACECVAADVRIPASSFRALYKSASRRSACRGVRATT
jgi:hypothetical protein